VKPFKFVSLIGRLRIMYFGDHTSKQIIGSKDDSLKDKKIILCITGSVAAIKSPEIARELMRYGAEVFTVMTDMAQMIIHPYMMEWSTGNPVVTKLTGQIEHVTYGGDHPDHADLILVAPCTANTIGKVAAAIDDTPVTTLLTTAIGENIPIIIAPAMHASMYKHPVVKENIKKLEAIGIEILIPRFEDEKAKIPETDDVVNAVVNKLSSEKNLKGKRILVTAGPTREYLDGFRYISNPSSGKMGIAIVEEAHKQGAEVTLVYGPGTATPPDCIDIVNVETTEEMLDAVVGSLKRERYDIVILSAAAADYGAKDRKLIKTPSGREKWNIELIPVPKIIEKVKKIDPKVLLVGFKAEYNIKDDELIEKASKRMKETGMDLVVANDVSRENAGFGTDTNEVIIVDRDGKVIETSLKSKREIARILLTLIKEMIDG
jgi:phosphopantothenoylcysteine decarboxylase/phosphopantothenate--cysteine ligase